MLEPTQVGPLMRPHWSVDRVSPANIKPVACTINVCDRNLRS